MTGGQPRAGVAVESQLTRVVPSWVSTLIFGKRGRIRKNAMPISEMSKEQNSLYIQPLRTCFSEIRKFGELWKVFSIQGARGPLRALLSNNF